MAKAKTAVAVVAKNAVARNDANLPAFLQGYKGPRGTEDIDSSDITIPRIKIGQGTSDEVKDGTLKEGDQFLNLTKEVLAANAKPLKIVVVARNKEYILWRPRKDNGGGIIARAKAVMTKDGKRYKWDKPNTKFEVKVDGKIKAIWETKTYIDEDGLDQWGSEIPGNIESGIAATGHHNYIVVLPEHGDLVAAVSLSRSSAKKAKDFNALLKLGQAPIWARVFTATTVDEHNDQGDFKNVEFANAGFIDDASAKAYQGIFDAFSGHAFNVDHSDGNDDTTGNGGAL